MSEGIDKYKSMMSPKPSVHDELIDDVNSNASDNANIDLKTIPVVKKKANIRETHKSKAFYIRKDIAKLIEEDIRKGSRGDMTKIANALFEEYYRSQGRIK